METISLSIREFAMPVPRTGSIEALSGYVRAAEDGQEIHSEIQEKRAKSDPLYRAEVRINHSFEHDGLIFNIGGRMDGLTSGDPPVIEEIKSTFSVRELARKLSEERHSHPYCLQLRTYGYLYWLQNQVEPKLRFCLVSTRNGETQTLEMELDVPSYESWLSLRLSELAEETRQSQRRAARRRKIAANFPFPFDRPRPGQTELIRSIEESFAERKRLMIQAPTGLGKTAGVLYPALKESLARGHKVVYATPKNSQHLVAEDAVHRFQETGSPIKPLTLTAKSKICFKAEPLCNPDYCEYAKDYYTKVHEHRLVEKLAKKRKLSARTFRKMGEEYQVCPFELQLDAAQEADVVICDYNYVFAPRVSSGIMTTTGAGMEGKPTLVIDEAHNLPSRSMDYYSPSLSSLALEKMRECASDLPKRFRSGFEELLDGCIQAILSCKPNDNSRSSRIDPPSAPFLDQEASLRAYLSRYLESDAEIQPKDPVLRLCFYWSEFTGALQYVTESKREEFFVTFHPHPSGGTVKITCCDASALLKERYDEYESVVAFSATLKPFDYYARLSGLDPERLKTLEFKSPFPKGHRKILIIPQISTKYSERERNYPKVAEAIRRITEVKKGNYFAFFPSFEFLERVLERFDPPSGFEVLRQERQMRTPEIERVLEHLRSSASPSIVFAVQGGVFSEGVDYPGNMVIGAFVVGPPLPSFDLEREEMKAFYEKNYGAGFDYAYTFPAMAKAVQAAGRVIRSENDRGIIVLMDDRFVHPHYTQSMPGDWYERSPRELISSGILKEVSHFWSSYKKS